jgi:hypothetical protein
MNYYTAMPDLASYDWTPLTRLIMKRKAAPLNKKEETLLQRELQLLIYSMTLQWHILPEDDASGFLLSTLPNIEKILSKWNSSKGTFKNYLIGSIYKLASFHNLRKYSDKQKESTYFLLMHNTRTEQSNYAVSTNPDGTKELIISSSDKIFETEPAYRLSSYALLETNLQVQAKSTFKRIVKATHKPLDTTSCNFSPTEQRLHEYLAKKTDRRAILLYFLTFTYDAMENLIPTLASLFNIDEDCMQLQFLSLRPLALKKIFDHEYRRNMSQKHLNSMIMHVEKSKDIELTVPKKEQIDKQIRSTGSLFRKSYEANKEIRISQNQLAEVLDISRGTIAGYIVRAKKILKSCLDGTSAVSYSI